MISGLLALAFAAAPAPGIVSIVPEAARPMYENFHFSPAVRAGDMIYLSGVVAPRPEGEDPNQADYEAVFERAFQTLEYVLAEAGADFSQVADMTTYHVDFANETQRAAFMAVKDRYMGEPYPAWTAIGIERLWTDTGLVEIKLTVYAPQDSE